MDAHSLIKDLKARVDYLEEIHRFTVDALEIAASLGDFQSNIRERQGISSILNETGSRVKKLIPFQIIGFHLVDETSPDFHLVDCRPKSERKCLVEETDFLIDNGTFAWALRENRAVRVSTRDFERQIILHVMATHSRICGLFCGILPREEKNIPEVSLSLLSIILLNSANAMESFKTYEMLRKAQAELEDRIKDRTINLAEVNKKLQEEVAERKRAEEKTKTSLKEKEVLLREVHHRVKNNMQVISSLLNMQSKYLTDAKAIDVLMASMTRIRSMALIHNKLYQSEGLSSIDVCDYIHSLSRSLLSAYSVDSHIDLNIDIDPLSLNIDMVMPLGLLINELVTNSLKHAFPGKSSGRIDIRLKTDNEQLVLTISDNGISLPPDLDHMNAESMGMQLIITLVEQLEGTIELNRDKGTEFRVTFSLA